MNCKSSFMVDLDISIPEASDSAQNEVKSYF
jgi:hypothetical protein